MYTRDYIMRIIEQLGQALARLMASIRGGDGEGLAEVESELNAIATRAGLDLEIARLLEPESLHVMVAPLGEVDPGRCWTLAELLYLYALQAEKRGQSETANGCYERSLFLYRMVKPDWRSTLGLPPVEQRISEIQARAQA